MIQNDTSQNQNTIHHLNSFLRGELSAVETYQQALAKLTDFGGRSTLEHCARSHKERAKLLAEEIRRRGGEPADGAGPWGVFVKLVGGGAALLGSKAALAALEEGEDHGRDDYRRDLKELDAPARHLVESRVLPEQLRTHDAIGMLQRTLAQH